MLFITGISFQRKIFNFSQLITCAECGQYGRFNVFMTYYTLTIFFIPTIKWKKRYYVQTSCCGTIYELDPEIGKAVARGEDVHILQSNLRKTRERAYYQPPLKRCSHCGYMTRENFQFCPKCGEEM